MKLKKLDDIGKPYAIYADALDGNTIEQFVTAMQHDAVLHGALMPDAHSGYSLPIGGVVLCKETVFPAFVGYDIGCGVSTIKTAFTPEEVQKNADAIFDAIYEAIPTGVGKNNAQPVHPFCSCIRALADMKRSSTADEHYRDLGMLQLCTLGSGNHFIEIGSTEAGEVFVTVHSGSRNLGHYVATHYMKVASGSDKAKEGVYGLKVHTREAVDYLDDMLFCTAYAKANRDLMLSVVIQVLDDVLKPAPPTFGGPAHGGVYVNKAHNFIEIQPGNLMLHRKGATIATEGTLGVIPGNMRDGVYVVEGLGNMTGLCSCSHGAGRTMSRAKAKDVITMEDFTEAMQGIKAKITEGTKDESPFAYKNFEDVMRLQSDLAKIRFHIKPLINVKG